MDCIEADAKKLIKIKIINSKLFVKLNSTQLFVKSKCKIFYDVKGLGIQFMTLKMSHKLI